MKIAIISDTHLGDSQCVLSDNKSVYYKNLIQTLSDNIKGEKYRYLVILGDSLDLAVTNYYDAINAAKPFFTGIKDLFEEILLIPGNHDHDLWTMLQFQKQIAGQAQPARNTWTASGFIHNINGTLTLQPNSNPGQSFHTGTFLDQVFPNTFIVAAPNLYLIDDDKTILMTHGQYFEFAWAFMGDWTARAFGNDLKKIPMDNLQHILGDDFLSNQVICSGLGQSEINLANIIQNLEHDFKAKDYSQVVKYIVNFILSCIKSDDIIHDAQNKKQEILAFMRSVFSIVTSTTRDHNDLDLLEKAVKHGLSDALTSRFTLLKKGGVEDVISKIWENLEIKEVVGYHKSLTRSSNDSDESQDSDWIKRYISASNSDFKIKNLQYMIFGHTHHPVKWNNGASSKIDPCPSNTKQIANCGGWLSSNGGKSICGAELFIYDSVTKNITDISFK